MGNTIRAFGNHEVTEVCHILGLKRKHTKYQDTQQCSLIEQCDQFCIQIIETLRLFAMDLWAVDNVNCLCELLRLPSDALAN